MDRKPYMRSLKKYCQKIIFFNFSHTNLNLKNDSKKIFSLNHFLKNIYSINEIFEQEDENLMKREMMIAKEALHK